MGIFAVRNRTNGKILLGASLNLPGSLNRTRFQLQHGSHKIAALQQDWTTYGADGFSFEVLDELPPVEDKSHDYREDLNTLESLWLDKLRPYGDAGYNTPPTTDR
ncbi:MAG: GIY-YIG nuclease family protein [Deltaproteobacteria bacterium]|nr:GIY-YIG nuclease family protein [Deltaproteobacteria bacterium]MBI3386634.1 GIY-YIG nuclease family protein [Deltaproteobacteria bacterium]